MYRYTKNQAPKTCPKCGSTAWSNEEENFVDDESIIIKYSCNAPNCNFTWTELYRFINWEPDQTE